MDQGWLGRDADALFEEACKRPFTVINDAQAAVLAEVRCGAARGAEGLVLMLTFGTGIGSGLDDSHFFATDTIVDTTPVLFAIARKPRRFPPR